MFKSSKIYNFIHSSIPYITIDSLKQLKDDIGKYKFHRLSDIMPTFYPYIIVTDAPYLLLSGKTNDKTYILKFDSPDTLKYLSDNANLNVPYNYINNYINSIQTFDYNETDFIYDNHQYTIAIIGNNLLYNNGFELSIIDNIKRLSIFSAQFVNGHNRYIYWNDDASKRFNVYSKTDYITIDKLPDDIKNHIQSYMTLLLLKKECNYV